MFMQEKVPISVLIPTKNEINNIDRCIMPLIGWADQIVVVDSGSTDGTVEYCNSKGIEVVNFEYNGGWPKKRQWALDTYAFRNNWILLLDSDEILNDNVKNEIGEAIKNPNINGFWVRFEIYFLGKQLKYGSTALWKLSLFRTGTGKYEKRMADQDKSMADMEVHEHVVVSGAVGYLSKPVKHENCNSLDRYIHKHNEYSNWDAALFFKGEDSELKPSLFGNQAQKRRWLKMKFLAFPFSEFLFFLYLYVFRLGFLDGIPGFIHAMYKGVQIFHIKSKIYEIKKLSK